MNENTFANRLKAKSQPIWEQTINHRFVKELINGTIDDQVLKQYLIQDYQFLDAFLSLLGAAVANVDELPPKLTLAKQLAVIAGHENNYFMDAFTELQVTQDEIKKPTLADATKGFIALMKEVSHSNNYSKILAVLLVAEWLYLEWAQTANNKLPERYIHSEWIVIHDNHEFVLWVNFIKSEINRIETKFNIDQIQTTINRAVALEKQFFDDAYNISNYR